MNQENLFLTNSYLEQEKEAQDWESSWKSIRANRWFILTVAAVVFSLTTLFVLFLPNVYTAETTILIERAQNTPVDYKEMLLALGDTGDYFGTRVEVLKSRPILEETAEELSLVNHYRKTDKKIKTNQEAAAILKDRIHVVVMKATQLMKVQVEDGNPEMSAKIANALAESFIKESWRERFFISKQLLEWFPAEAQTLQRNNSFAQLRKLEETKLMTSLPSVASDPVINAIKLDQRKLEGEINKLSRRYTEEHPEMKELRVREAYLESELKAQTEKIVAGLKAALAGEFSASTIKVVENAIVPTAPSGPPRLRMILVATLLAVILSSTLAIVLDRLNRNIRGDEDVRKISLPFLGHLSFLLGLDPKAKNGGREGISDLMVSDHRLIDEISNIRASILFSLPAERGKLIMLTSALPQEGKTTVALMLGISLAESGERVLLVDADLRNPSLHRVLKLENRCGLSDCLVGTTNFRDAVQVIEKNPNLHVITAGGRTPNPVVLLGSVVADNLIQQLSSEYDRIIFDVPPVLHMADALILAGKVHATILVFQSGRIHVDIGRKLVEKINSAKGLIIGAVINRAHYEKLNYPYYELYRQYSKYYQGSRTAQ